MIRKRFKHWRVLCATQKNGIKNYDRRVEYRKRSAKRLEDAWNTSIHLKVDDSPIGEDVCLTEGMCKKGGVNTYPTTSRPENPPVAGVCKKGGDERER